MNESDSESNQTIVINDLLSFVWCKLKLFDKKKVLKCIENFYSRETARDALKTLLAALPIDNYLFLQRKLYAVSDPHAEIVNILDSRTFKDLPIFVCKNLNNVPKLNITSEKSNRAILDSRKTFFDEHNNMKLQIDDVLNSLHELRQKFKAVLEEENKSVQKESDANKEYNGMAPKDLTYLQKLIDSEKYRNEELDESDVDGEEISEQEINLLANRKQRASINLKKDSFTGHRQSGIYKTEEENYKLDSSHHNIEKNVKLETEPLEDLDDKPYIAITSSKFNPDGSSRYLLVEHEFDENLGTFSIFRCSLCLFCSNDEATAMEHSCVKGPFNSVQDKKTVQSSTKQKEQRQRVKTYNKCYICNTCESIFTSKGSLEQHMEVHIGKGYRCPLCTNRYPLQEWEEHVRMCPENNAATRKDHYCNICDVFYANRQTLSFHKAYHDMSRSFECSECKFRFYSQKAVSDHKKTHDIHREGHKCPFCDFRSNFSVRIIEHVRSHTGDKPYKCPKCEQYCRTYNSLQFHLASHNPTRDYPCDVCGKKFKSQDRVSSHKKVHGFENSYKCPICGKGFKMGLQMTLHHRTHFNVRKHSCPWCPYRATSASVLRGHMNTHTNSKPFKCSLCEFRANHKSYLSWHLKYYHPKSDS